MRQWEYRKNKLWIIQVASAFILSLLFGSPIMAASVTIAAKTMKLSGTYKVNSAGTQISLSGASGKAVQSFSAATGNYKVVIRAVGSASAQSKLDLYVGSKLIQSFIYPKVNGAITLKTKGISVKNGDQIRLMGFKNNNGDARVKDIVFTALAAAAPAPKPPVASTPTPAPAPARAPASTGGFSVSKDAHLVSVVDFESSSTTSQFLSRGKRCEYDCLADNTNVPLADAFTVVSDITRNGRRAGRLAIDSRIPYPQNKPRSDLAMVGDFRNVYPGNDTWVGFSVYYPNNHVFATGGTDQTWGPQISEIQADGESYNQDCAHTGGPVSLNEFGDTFTLKLRWSGTLTDCLNKKYKHTSFPNLAKITKGAWHDIIIHYRLCADLKNGCTPKVELWINGKQVVNSSALVGDVAIENKVWYKVDVAYYAHHETKGAYNRPLGVYSINVDDIRIAYGTDAKDLVDPAKN